MAQSARDGKLREAASTLGFDTEAEIRIGGDYVPVLLSGSEAYVSGQIPRIGDKVVCVGKVGAEVSLREAQHAAKISTVRILALLQRALGSLDRVEQVLRITVFVHSDPGFTQQSEVADGASSLLKEVLGDAGAHTRTSVGAAQLPKGAAVEVDLVARTAG